MQDWETVANHSQRPELSVAATQYSPVLHNPISCKHSCHHAICQSLPVLRNGSPSTSPRLNEPAQALIFLSLPSQEQSLVEFS